MKSFYIYDTKEAIEYNTSRSRQKAEYYLHKCQQYALDLLREDRIKDCECRTCYYFYNDRIAGQAFTKYECGICHKEDSWPNTGIPRICLDCCNKNFLCHRCGASLGA